MINFYKRPVLITQAWKKTLKIMRLVIVLLLTGILQIHAAAYSQEVYNINVNNATVKQMFKQIESSGKYSIFYRNDQVDLNQKVQVVADHASIEDVMKQVLHNQNLSFQLMDNVIVIKSANDKNAAPVSISGVLSDSKGEVLPGVTVKLKGTTIGTVTDINGRYNLTVPDGTGTLVFNFIGYVTKEVPINGQLVMNVRLEDESKSLNEVVVVGYATQKKKKQSPAEPYTPIIM